MSRGRKPAISTASTRRPSTRPTRRWWPTRARRRTSRRSWSTSRRRTAASGSRIDASTGPGAVTRASMRVSAFLCCASWSCWVCCCRCCCFFFVLCSGWWCAARRASPAVRRSFCSRRINRRISPSACSTDWKIRARCRSRSSRCSRAPTSARTTSCVSTMCTGGAAELKILITGGAGFIGSAVMRQFINETENTVINVDKLTYAGNLESVAEVAGSPRYRFERGDICDAAAVRRLFVQHRPDAVMHLAAESHVDRSIDGPAQFIETNIVGTYTILEAAREYWNALAGAEKDAFRFHHISTDEVYGTLGSVGFFLVVLLFLLFLSFLVCLVSSDHLVCVWFF